MTTATITNEDIMAELRDLNRDIIDTLRTMHAQLEDLEVRVSKLEEARA